jgi:SAM-dependent methyltransferase
MANDAMKSAWDGEEGARWVEHADKYEAQAVFMHRTWFDTIEFAGDEAVLDIGCGNGGTSLRAAELVPTGSVLGVDLSSQMLELAAKRASARGLHNVAFEQADAQTYAFAPARFDIAISSFGVMFFDDPVAAFSNIAGALRPGGRISFLVWRALPDVPWMFGVRSALANGRDVPVPPPDAPSPFALARPERNAALLTAAGFADVDSRAVSDDAFLGTTLDDAFEFVSQTGMAKGATETLSDDEREAAFAALREYLAGFVTDDGVRIPSGAWIVTARKPR